MNPTYFGARTGTDSETNQTFSRQSDIFSTIEHIRDISILRTIRNIRNIRHFQDNQIYSEQSDIFSTIEHIRDISIFRTIRNIRNIRHIQNNQTYSKHQTLYNLFKWLLKMNQMVYSQPVDLALVYTMLYVIYLGSNLFKVKTFKNPNSCCFRVLKDE